MQTPRERGQRGNKRFPRFQSTVRFSVEIAAGGLPLAAARDIRRFGGRVKRVSRACREAALVCPAGLIVSGPASAQTAPDAGALQREAERNKPQPPTPVPTLEENTRPESAEGLKVSVSRFVFSGNTLLSEAELQEVVRPLHQKPLALDELKWIASKISDAYREKGYLARKGSAVLRYQRSCAATVCTGRTAGAPGT